MDAIQNAHDALCEVTDVHDLTKLAELLKQDLPNSAVTYNVINMKLKIFQDSVRIFVAGGNYRNRSVVWKLDNYRQMGVTCPPENVLLLKKGLLDTSLIDYSVRRMWTVPEPLVSMVMEVLRERLHDEPSVAFIMQAFYMTPEEGLSLQPCQCKEGLVCALGEGGIRRMYDTWDYRHLVSYTSLRDFAPRVPSIGLYLHPTAAATKSSPPSTSAADDASAAASERPCYPIAPDDEIPVSWASLTTKGTMGKLFTEEKYRRKGYAKIITHEFCRLTAWEGYAPLSMVNINNAPSLAFHRKCGFKLGHKDHWIR